MTNPVALVSKKGLMIFCNEAYEQMVEQRLGQPANVSVFKLEEENSNIKMRQMIEQVTGPSKTSGACKAEVKLIKANHRQKPSPVLGLTLNSKQGIESLKSQDPLS